ncbi:acetolactate decarboxylase [Dellaglioa algida]|uniref:acetolactate decarboxylase n=1 Tax=Dellaglioa algida TaxID=105612 RepID=UPI000BCB5FB9|nr:acetolactate decarboxylase [Dellaglioa algida]MDK1718997.1 acetolactate decarboxylase [Dellaglioa algida]MDK1730075.1 acetolactate decarboxylase [Dellaglioa algida]MDK1742509.1 acetolactate decarboxylase [Dellaglioa algida]SOB51598.1 Alpha-acetolactate decarboxylase [Dellaglioa algida]
MHETNKIYQHGTLATLIEGLYEGTLSVGELLKHGDYGIGTVGDLDGEMIAMDGKAFQITSEGQVNQLTDNVLVPFATVHFHQPDVSIQFENVAGSILEEQLLELYPYQNLFFGIVIKGTFSKMNTRSVAKQSKPYPTLTAVTAEQSEFSAEHIDGTIVGYFTPKLFQGIGAAGFHLHFLSDEMDMGGHILDYHLENGMVSLQPFSSLEQHFPIENDAFLKSNVNVAKLHDEIKLAEN